MKKLVVMLMVAATFIPYGISATPCTDGYSACVSGGGSHSACYAGWRACMKAMYDYDGDPLGQQ